MHIQTRVVWQVLMFAVFLILAACGGGGGDGGGGGGSQSPTVSINTPTGWLAFDTADTINFTGTANDVEDGVLTGASLVWVSSIDGQIGTGTSVSAVLTEGTHTISLTATDSSGASAERAVVISTVSVSLSELGALESNMVPQGMKLVGNLAYVADKYSGLHIVDVSSPDNPVVVGKLTTAGEAKQVAVNGQYAYLAEGYDPFFTATVSGALRVIDVSNATSPNLLGSYIFAAAVNDVEVVGNLVFVVVADFIGASRFVILDVADPSMPVELASMVLTGQALDVEIVGDVAFIVERQTGLRIVDISNPSSPVEISLLNIANVVNDVEVSGNVAYVANDAAGVQIVDISDLMSPVITATVATPGQAVDVEVQGNLIFVAGLNTGLMIYDVSDPANPLEKDSLDTGATYEVEVMGSMVYVADIFTGLRILDVSTPANIVETGNVDLPGIFPVLDIEGTRAYIGDTNYGLRIVDIANPSALLELGSLSFASPVPQQGSLSSRDVEAAGSKVYFVTPRSIKIVDVSDPVAPVKIGEFSASWAEDIEVVGDVAYLADQFAFRILDVSNPSAVVETGRVDINGSTTVLEVVGSTVYIGYGGNVLPGVDSAGILIVDVSDPTAPAIIGNLDLGTASGNQVFDVEIVGSRIFALTATLGMLAVDISDPANPVQISQAGNIIAASLSKFAMVGEKAYISGDFMRVAVVADPENMAALTTDLWIPGNWDIVVRNNLFYIADRKSGLRVLQ